MVIYLPPSLSSKLFYYALWCQGWDSANSFSQTPMPIVSLLGSVNGRFWWQIEGKKGPLVASFYQQLPPIVRVSSFFQSSQHTTPDPHRGTNTHWPHLPWWSDLVLSSTPLSRGCVECLHQRSKSQPARDLSFTIPGSGNPTSFLLFSQPSSGNFLQLLRSALGAQEAMTNIWVILSSPLSSNIDVPNSLYWICSIGNT